MSQGRTVLATDRDGFIMDGADRGLFVHQTRLLSRYRSHQWVYYYPFAFAMFMSWANPIMVERTGLVPMAAAHALFGVVLGFTYLLLRRDARVKNSAAFARRT